MYGKSIFVFCLIFFSNYAADHQGVYLGTEASSGRAVFQFPGYFRIGLSGDLQLGQPNFPIVPPQSSSSAQRVFPGAFSSAIPQSFSLTARQPVVQTSFFPFSHMPDQQAVLQYLLNQQQFNLYDLMLLQISQQQQQNTFNKKRLHSNPQRKKQLSKPVHTEETDIKIISPLKQSSAAEDTEVVISKEDEQELERQKRKNSSDVVVAPNSSQSRKKKVQTLRSDLVKPEAGKEAPKETAVKPTEKDRLNITYNQTRNVVEAIEQKSVDISCDESLIVVSPVEPINLTVEANPITSTVGGFEIDAAWIDPALFDLDTFMKSDEEQKVAQEEKDAQQIFTVLWLVGAHKKIGQMPLLRQKLSSSQQKQFDFATTLQPSLEKSLDQEVRSAFASGNKWHAVFQTLKQNSTFSRLYDSLVTGKHEGNSYPFFTLVQSVLHVFASRMVQPSSKISLHIPPFSLVEEGEQPFVQEYLRMLQKVFNGFTGTARKDFSFLTRNSSISLGSFLALVDCTHFHQQVWLTMQRDLSLLAHQSIPLSIVVHSESEQLSLASSSSSSSSSSINFLFSGAFGKLMCLLKPVEPIDTFSTALHKGRLFLIALLGNHLSKKIEKGEGFSEEDRHHADNFKKVIEKLFDMHALDSDNRLTVSCIKDLHSLCLDYEDVQKKIFPTKGIADLIHNKGSSVVSTIKVLQTNKSDVTILNEAASYFENRVEKAYYN